jgi:hypothetical protein
MIRISVVLAVFVLSNSSAQAEQFETLNLTRGETVRGCVSEEAVGALLAASGNPDFWQATSSIATITRQACPRYGPFIDDIMKGVVIHRDTSSDWGDYDQLVVIRWSLENSERYHYSTLIENRFGVWSGAVETFMDARAVGGFLELFKK